jgi:pyruvate/2-oxoglutarate dehydrogenase complex dihydrolipoamide acyltransferase (E2) component
MRRLIRTGIAAAGFVLALGVASATDRDAQTPESRAYFSLSFGGERVAPRNLHYGLRLDHDSRFVDGTTAPLMQFDFTRRGLHDAQLNGLSVLKQSYRLRQSEEEAAAEAGSAPAEEPAAEEAPAEAAPAESAPAEAAATDGVEESPADGGEVAAEEGGFFSNMWGGVTGFFGGLFGGDEEDEVAEAPAEAAPADSAEAPPEELADGMFASFGVVDWGLLALGAAGIGLAASEVAGGDEDPDSAGGGGTSGTTTGGGCNTSFLTTTCLTTPTYAPNRWTTPYDVDRQDPEYRKWLDGGTGQMGDLGG